MAYDIYISYATPDNNIAHSIYEYLERETIKCYIAHQDLAHGKNISEELFKAIQTSRAFLLLLTPFSNKSGHILQEVKWAIQAKKTIIILRLEDIALSKPLEMLIKNSLSLKGSLPLTQEILESLTKMLLKLLFNKDNVDKLGKDFDVFICFRSNDFSYAKQLFDFLRAKGLRAFFSSETLRSPEFIEEISRAIEHSRNMAIVTSSANNVNSKWVKHEWNCFLNEILSGRKEGILLTVATEEVNINELPINLRSMEVIRFNPEGFNKMLKFIK
ncbi:MAG: hypothetical protein A2Y62_03475 [Candidatus Fischerbacteria bacterium RBG_13_37_8]|uniref:TIR domain-containing protein n=1 Tax=Candidatus Fischerbacteria bacterium RBG_13_37_8 TaxID=1817863 RepID=A0A1F5VK22_9BACT|nr:MAG: hypothetical protein A2Y62_03475 [Candidatus Fischerbacteria bacterium RBG_13_37_8]